MPDDNLKISKVVVLRDLCIGAAPCTTIAPDVFELDEEGKAVVKEGWEGTDAKTILEGAESCPVHAIEVYDEAGNKIHPK